MLLQSTPSNISQEVELSIVATSSGVINLEIPASFINYGYNLFVNGLRQNTEYYVIDLLNYLVVLPTTLNIEAGDTLTFTYITNT